MITRFEEMRKGGQAASMIERQTAKFPIDTFLWAAGGSILISLFLKRQGRDEDALRAITLDAASVLGIDDRCGSLAVAKEATLIVSNGDALDMRTNSIRLAFIQGRRIELDDHQQQLYRLYRQRYERSGR